MALYESMGDYRLYSMCWQAASTLAALAGMPNTGRIQRAVANDVVKNYGHSSYQK